MTEKMLAKMTGSERSAASVAALYQAAELIEHARRHQTALGRKNAYWALRAALRLGWTTSQVRDRMHPPMYWDL